MKPLLTAIVSKRSRAARRGEIELDGEVKQLEDIPKVEDNGVKKSIIRTTIKNENLLTKKMENSRIRKGNIKKTATLKRKLDRSDKVSGVLATKIEQSIARAKYVQTARKSTWSKIDQEALESIASTTNIVKFEPSKQKTEAEIEQEEEDAYVKDFFGDENTKKNSDDVNLLLSKNRFALLEVEE